MVRTRFLCQERLQPLELSGHACLGLFDAGGPVDDAVLLHPGWNRFWFFLARRRRRLFIGHGAGSLHDCQLGQQRSRREPGAVHTLSTRGARAVDSSTRPAPWSCPAIARQGRRMRHLPTAEQVSPSKE